MRVPTALPLVLLTASVFAAGCDARVKNAEVQGDAHADLAREAFQRGDVRRALDEAQTAVSFDDSNARAHALATAALLSLCAGDEGTSSPDCRLDLAEKHAKKTLALDPTDRNARNTLGSVLLLEGGRGSDALDVLRPLTQDPAFASAHLAWANFGWAQLQVGKPVDAVDSLRRAVREPRFCVGWYRLAVAYEAAGKPREAEECVSRAVGEKLPECQTLQDAWRFRGELRVKQGKTHEARSDLETCERLAPHTASGRACAELRASLTPGPEGKAS